MALQQQMAIGQLQDQLTDVRALTTSLSANVSELGDSVASVGGSVASGVETLSEDIWMVVMVAGGVAGAYLLYQQKDKR